MDETDIDLRNILGLLRRRLRLILTTAAVVIGGATIALFVLTPQYTSTALILVDTDTKNLLAPSGVQTSAAGDSARVDSEVEILKSSNILMSVIESENLVTDKEFGATFGLQDRLLSLFQVGDTVQPGANEALQSALTGLKSAVSIRRNGLTHLISVSVSSQEPAKAARLANTIATTYIGSQILAKVRSIQFARDTLQARISADAQSIVDSEESFDGFIADNIEAIALKTGRADIAEMRNKLLRLDAERAERSNAANTAAKLLGLQDWATLSKSLGDEAIAALYRQRDETAKRLEAAFGSPLVINLQAELTKIDSDLNAAAQDGISALSEQVNGTQNAANEVKQQLRSSVLNSDLPPEVLTRIFALQQNSQIARTQYQNLLTRVSNLDAQAQTQIADSRIVSEALASGKPSSPDTSLVLTLAAVTATGLSIGLAFLYENFVGGFLNTEQVQSVLRTTGSLSVPYIALNTKTQDGSKVAGAADFMVTSPLSAYAESIRRIRLTSERAVADRKKTSGQTSGAVILVSSAVPGEGKSTISLSLARAFAQAGKATLLIDCDLRKPGLHKYLGVENDVGLADYLRHPDEPGLLSKIITSDRESPLAAVVGSRRADIPTDQLSGGASLSKLIEAARSRSEFVILDSPPILSVIDGLYLAEHADAIAMVIRWASTSQNETRDALTALSGAKKPSANMFTILSQQETGMHGYKYRYGAYHEQS